MKPFGLTVLTKKSIIDFRLGSKYASVIEVAFSKISKFSQKITILVYSFSKVIGLKENWNSNFCVAQKNRLVKIEKLESSVTKEVTVCFYNFGEAKF